MSVFAERDHDQQVAKHCHYNDDGQKDGENNLLHRSQELPLVPLFFCV